MGLNVAKKKKIKDLVLYEYDRYECWWEDATSGCEWKDRREAIKDQPAMCFTEGYLITFNKNYHTFCMSFTGNDIGDQMIIPTKNIKKMKFLSTRKFYKKEYDYGTYKN
jgi:hypothetical protein